MRQRAHRSERDYFVVRTTVETMIMAGVSNRSPVFSERTKYMKLRAIAVLIGAAMITMAQAANHCLTCSPSQTVADFWKRITSTMLPLA